MKPCAGIGSQRRQTQTDHRTTWPYKGEADYDLITAYSRTVDNAVWSYEGPHPGMEATRGHLAFYPDEVRLKES